MRGDDMTEGIFEISSKQQTVETDVLMQVLANLANLKIEATV
jgi:hypothetical protein